MHRPQQSKTVKCYKAAKGRKANRISTGYKKHPIIKAAAQGKPAPPLFAYTHPIFFPKDFMFPAFVNGIKCIFHSAVNCCANCKRKIKKALDNLQRMVYTHKYPISYYMISDYMEACA